MTTPPDPFSEPYRSPAQGAPGGSGYGSGPGPYGSGPYGPSPSGPGPTAGTTDVKAMIALGLAIAAYTPAIPFLGAIAALVLAGMARRDILASGGAKTGLGLCRWAVALSVVHLVLVALLFLLLLAVFLLPVTLLGI